MANQHGATILPSDMDYPEHERTYRMFTGMMKWGTIHIVVLLILMAYFLL